MGDGFIVTADQAASLDAASVAIARDRTPDQKPHVRTGTGIEPQIIFEYRNGRDLAAFQRGMMAIDLFGLSEAEVLSRYPAVYQHLLTAVKHHREINNRTSYRDNWWLDAKLDLI